MAFDGYVMFCYQYVGQLVRWPRLSHCQRLWSSHSPRTLLGSSGCPGPRFVSTSPARFSFLSARLTLTENMPFSNVPRALWKSPAVVGSTLHESWIDGDLSEQNTATWWLVNPHRPIPNILCSLYQTGPWKDRHSTMPELHEAGQQKCQGLSTASFCHTSRCTEMRTSQKFGNDILTPVQSVAGI